MRPQSEQPEIKLEWRETGDGGITSDLSLCYLEPIIMVNWRRGRSQWMGCKPMDIQWKGSLGWGITEWYGRKLTDVALEIENYWKNSFHDIIMHLIISEVVQQSRQKKKQRNPFDDSSLNAASLGTSLLPNVHLDALP